MNCPLSLSAVIATLVLLVVGSPVLALAVIVLDVMLTPLTGDSPAFPDDTDDDLSVLDSVR